MYRWMSRWEDDVQMGGINEGSIKKAHIIISHNESWFSYLLLYFVFIYFVVSAALYTYFHVSCF